MPQPLSRPPPRSHRAIPTRPRPRLRPKCASSRSDTAADSFTSTYAQLCFRLVQLHHSAPVAAFASDLLPDHSIEPSLDLPSPFPSFVVQNNDVQGLDWNFRSTM